jgi:hypothetical protein
MTRRKRKKMERESKVMQIEGYFPPPVSKANTYEAFVDAKHEYKVLDVPLAVKAIQRRVMQTTGNLFKSLEPLGFKTVYNKEADNFYCYKNAGHKVLAVAHADSVQEARFFNRKGNVLFSPSLDDRLGVAVAVDILPMMGIECDVLITDEEESANSSGKNFALNELKHNYNWIVEFDRAGSDCVTYSYDSKEWHDALESAGFRLGFGSYSDICEMESMGVCAMNVGVGYENYHSMSAFANMIALDNNLEIFKYFYAIFKDKKFAHTERVYASRYGDYGFYSRYGEYDEWGKYQAAKYDTKSLDVAPKDHYENRRLMCPDCSTDFWEFDMEVIQGMAECLNCGEWFGIDEAVAEYEDFCDKFFNKQFDTPSGDVDAEVDRMVDRACMGDEWD